MKDVILEEVNIKELIVLENDSEIVSKTAKANFKSIGPKFGKLVKSVAAAITRLDGNQIKILEEGKSIFLNIADSKIEISLNDVEIISSEIKGWVVESEAGVTVAIDAELNDELISEGLAREFINRIQNMRKDAGFEVIDKIKIFYKASDKISHAVSIHKDYIASETLAIQILQSEITDGGFNQEWKMNEQDCLIKIEKANS